MPARSAWATAASTSACSGFSVGCLASHQTTIAFSVPPAVRSCAKNAAPPSREYLPESSETPSVSPARASRAPAPASTHASSTRGTRRKRRTRSLSERSPGVLSEGLKTRDPGHVRGDDVLKPQPGDRTLPRMTRCADPRRDGEGGAAKAALPVPPWLRRDGRRHDRGELRRPVDRAHDGAERRRDDALVDTDAPEHLVAERRLDVGRRRGVRPGAERVLGVVEHPQVDAGLRAEGRDERVDRPVPGAKDRALGPVEANRRLDPIVAGLAFEVAQRHELERADRGEVLLREAAPDLLRRDLSTLGVCDLLDRLRELDLQPARQLEAVL